MANLPALAISAGQVRTATATDTIVGAVGYGAIQSLSQAQQAQALSNLGLDVTRVTANPQSGAAYTLALSDAGEVVECTSASAVAVTVPLNATVAFPAGTVVEVLQYGAGQITLSPASGVTLRTPSSLTSRAQYSSLSLRYRGGNEWIVGGDLT